MLLKELENDLGPLLAMYGRAAAGEFVGLPREQDVFHIGLLE